jgi:hypothetical protein
VRAAIYARVSTLDQEPENQLRELRRYVQARGWTPAEYVDRGVSGAKDRRPALDQLLAAAWRRRFDVLRELAARSPLAESAAPDLAAGRASRYRRSVCLAVRRHRRHDPSWEAAATCPRGDRGVRAARIAERVRAGLARARSKGTRLGRPRRKLRPEDLERVASLSVRDAARELAVSKSVLVRWRLAHGFTGIVETSRDASPPA